MNRAVVWFGSGRLRNNDSMHFCFASGSDNARYCVKTNTLLPHS